jgi:RNA polymerase sigma-70 factor, ECF subfamily
MNNHSEVRTSATLLQQLRVLEDRQAWTKFMSLYMPLFTAWGKRAGLAQHDVDELVGRLLLKLVRELPKFQYDAARGSFRSWLKTLANRELANMAREAAHRLPGEKGTGSSEIFELLLQQPDGLDELVEGLQEASKGMAAAIHDSMDAIRDACRGDQQISWEIFRRNTLADEKITTLAKEFNLTVWAAGMRVKRMKQRIKARITQVLSERARIDVDEQRPRN